MICCLQASSLFSERVLKVKQLHINIFWATFLKNVIYEHKNDQLVIDNNESDIDGKKRLFIVAKVSMKQQERGNSHSNYSPVNENVNVDVRNKKLVNKQYGTETKSLLQLVSDCDNIILVLKMSLIKLSTSVT